MSSSSPPDKGDLGGCIPKNRRFFRECTAFLPNLRPPRLPVSFFKLALVATWVMSNVGHSVSSHSLSDGILCPLPIQILHLRVANNQPKNLLHPHSLSQNRHHTT